MKLLMIALILLGVAVLGIGGYLLVKKLFMDKSKSPGSGAGGGSQSGGIMPALTGEGGSQPSANPPKPEDKESKPGDKEGKPDDKKKDEGKPQGGEPCPAAGAKDASSGGATSPGAA